MGYNLKTPWELAELKKDGFPVFAPIVGSSSFRTATDCFVDLKLGRLGDPVEGLAEKFKVPLDSRMDPSLARSSRKARVRSNGAQAASCLVDGCWSDLSTCRDYHRRHKVCEAHSKTAIVTIGGQERRFCQQCSRFHSLAEFDEGKRSCRKRLDGHNRRRRKPQPETITLNPGRFLSNHNQGARYIPFGNPQVCATNPTAISGWANSGVVKAENDAMLYNNSHSLISFVDRRNSFPGHSYEEGKQFSFLHGTASTLPGDSMTQAFPDHIGSERNQKMFADGLSHRATSDRALSLLSWPPSKTREVGFSNAAQTSSGALSHSSNYGNLRHQEETSTGNVMGGSFHSQGTSVSGLDGSSVSTPHQTLFFSWE